MPTIKNKATREEYLEFDEASSEKHESYEGDIFAMAGGSFNHSTIGLNIATSLHNSLRDKPCQPMNSDMRIRTPSGLNTYPLTLQTNKERLIILCYLSKCSHPLLATTTEEISFGTIARLPL